MRLLIAALLSIQSAVLGADVVSLTNGDRVSGRVVGATTRRVRLQTPYGVLVLPRDRVSRIEHENGSVEVVTAPPPEPTPPPPPPPPPPIRLQLAISGDSFWRAWDPKSAPADPSLRLDVRLDDAPLVSYTDSTLDPEDLPKAVVNSFVFSHQELKVQVSPGVVAEPAIVAGAEIGLALVVPPEAAGRHRLNLAYQVNEGTLAEPMWRDAVTASAEIDLEPGLAIQLHLEQSRGTMAYAHRKMQDVSSFTATLRPEAATASAAASAP